MKVLNLRCAHGHAFEGWFGSLEEFDSQLQRELIECPVCGDKAIVKGLSAPRLNLGAARPPEAPSAAPASPAAAPPAEHANQAAARWMRGLREVLARTEDVGERFAEEARRMHYGEAEERGIRGQATRAEAEALMEEGVAVMPLVLPDALKETLQ